MSLDANLRSSLSQLAVLELGDESGDYGAMLLAGLGANVIKIEPLEGSPSRSIGPFASEARDLESSLFFWRYNLNKKSVALDLSHPEANAVLARMAARADIVMLSGAFDAVDCQLDLWRRIASEKPHLIVCSLTPFGLDGPYRDFKSTDLTQMALGGIMAMCGYDADQNGFYDTPPIAPAMWHSFHIAGEYVSVAIMAAVSFRDFTGEGQFIDASMCEAVNTCTELAVPIYLYNGEVVKRQTARHAFAQRSPMRLPTSADGVSILAGVNPFPREIRSFMQLAEESGIEHRMNTPEFAEQEKTDPAGANEYRNQLAERIVGSMRGEEIFVLAQKHGLPWSPIRRPEDNLNDAHFNSRSSFASIAHPELGRELRYPATVAGDGTAPHMSYTRRAPRLGEHTCKVLEEMGFAPDEIGQLARRKVI